VAAFVVGLVLLVPTVAVLAAVIAALFELVGITGAGWLGLVLALLLWALGVRWAARNIAWRCPFGPWR
jgi:hypothetical protein